MRNIASAVGGLAQGLNAYLGKTIDTQAKMAEQQQQSDLQARNTSEQQAGQLNNQQTLELYRQTLAGKVSPDVAAQIHPEAAGMVQKFSEQNNRMPTVDEFNNLMNNISEGTDKESKQQDTLEDKAMSRLTTVRGDQSLMRTELQRDAASMAYDTIVKAESEGRDLSQMEQSDLIGQIAKARFGKFTDEDRKAMEEKTGKRHFNSAITYLTGDPNLIGASTPETLANLKQFVTATGNKADEQWQSYMGPRMVKPTGLHQDRWDHIAAIHRGSSFADQQKASDKTYVSKGKSVEDKRAALRSKLGL